MSAFERKRAIAVISLAVMGAMIAGQPALGAATEKSAAKAKRSAKQTPATATARAAPAPAPVIIPQAKPIGKPGDWFPLDSYPPQARTAGQEGRTAFALDIDARGRITSCHITTSSGSDLLDSTTCTQLITNGRFEAAHDAAGKPVAGQWRSAMRWQLLAGATSEPDE